MKVCLFLQRNFSTLGNAVAKELKDLGVSEFCGYTYPLWAAKFLREQQDVQYTSLLVDEEVIADYKNTSIDYDYLKKIENEYGDPNLARYVFLDRFIMANYPQQSYSYKRTVPYEDALRMLQLRFKAIIDFLEKEKPDVVIFSAIALMSSTILYNVAKKKGIKTLQITTTRVGDRVGLMTEHESYGAILEKYKRNLAGNVDGQYLNQAKKYLSEYRNRPQKYANVAPYKSPGLFLRPWRAFRFFLKVLRDFYFTNVRFDYATQTPWNYFKERLARTMRRCHGVKDLFESPQDSDKYIFFPLHVEPESALSLLAPFYENQISLIRNIALSAPCDMKIYVKEHPAMLYERPRWYYKELLNIPNVHLIDTKFSSFELIKNADLITTITGTAGWEAVLMKKPVITFGNCFFNIFSCVKKSENPEGLPRLIRQQLDNMQYNESEVVNYLAALFEESISSDLYNAWHHSTYEKIIKEGIACKLAAYIFSQI